MIRLTSSCPKLKWIGDLRDWNISHRNRVEVLPNLLQGNGWHPAKCEPKENASSGFDQLSLHYHEGLSVADSFDILTKQSHIN